MEVEPTLFGETEDAPDDYVVHLDSEDINTDVSDRVLLLRENLGLEIDELKIATSVGLSHASELKKAVNKEMSKSQGLVWSGMPTYDQIQNLTNILCEVRSPTTFGAWSAKQLPFFINQLRFSKTMKIFLTDYHTGYQGKEHGQDNIFKFLRACEYGLPQHMSLINIFVKKKCPDADYSLFTYDTSTWFRSAILKNLDEEGIPIQISERFFRPNDTRASLMEKLRSSSQNPDSGLSAFERRWLESAIN